MPLEGGAIPGGKGWVVVKYNHGDPWREQRYNG